MSSLCPVASFFPKNTLDLLKRPRQEADIVCAWQGLSPLDGVLAVAGVTVLLSPLLIRLANGGDCGEAFCKGRRLFVIKDSN